MSKLLEEVGRRVKCLVMIGGDGDMAVGRIEAPCVRETEPVWPGYKTEALVVV
jgi:hypothetical protein